jgi:hypothetical protein
MMNNRCCGMRLALLHGLQRSNPLRRQLQLPFLFDTFVRDRQDRRYRFTIFLFDDDELQPSDFSAFPEGLKTERQVAFKLFCFVFFLEFFSKNAGNGVNFYFYKKRQKVCVRLEGSGKVQGM